MNEKLLVSLLSHDVKRINRNRKMEILFILLEFKV